MTLFFTSVSAHFQLAYLQIHPCSVATSSMGAVRCHCSPDELGNTFFGFVLTFLPAASFWADV